MTDIPRTDDAIDLAPWLRDWRLTRCEHAYNGDERPLVCSPCLRDRLLASDWLLEHDAALRAEGRAQALRDAAVALEGERRRNPMNGDGSNHMLDKVINRLDRLAGTDNPSRAAKLEWARREDEDDKRGVEMYGYQPIVGPSHVERVMAQQAARAAAPAPTTEAS